MPRGTSPPFLSLKPAPSSPTPMCIVYGGNKSFLPWVTCSTALSVTMARVTGKSGQFSRQLFTKPEPHKETKLSGRVGGRSQRDRDKARALGACGSPEMSIQTAEPGRTNGLPSLSCPSEGSAGPGARPPAGAVGAPQGHAGEEAGRVMLMKLQCEYQLQAQYTRTM